MMSKVLMRVHWFSRDMVRGRTRGGGWGSGYMQGSDNE